MKKNIVVWFVYSILILLLTSCSDTKTSITKLEDIKNISIGAMTGTTGEQIAITRFPEAKTKSFDDIMDAIAALKSNQIEAVITAFPTALNVTKHNQDLTILSEAVDFENTCIAVKKGNDEFLSTLNNIITELENDGTLADMKRRWLKNDLSPYDEPNILLPEKGKLLKIGTSATREPFCFVDGNQRVTGHDGEFARRVAAKLNRQMQFVDMKFSALIPALQSGKVDIIVAGMSSTEERAKSVDFSKPYFRNSQVLIVKKSDVSEQVTSTTPLLRTPSDLKDKKIGVLLGSVHDTYAIKNYPEAALLQYKSPPELVLGVKSGKIDAALYTTETLLEILRLDNELQMLGDTLFTIPIGMGFNKGNSQLREKFNQFLKDIKSDGTFDDLKNRWVLKGETIMPEIKNSKRNGTLIVGTVSDKGLPFTIVKDNRMIGFDIEISERFAAYLGKELKLVDMEFGSLIISAVTNKIEMISSTLMITDERKKQIDFSDEYMRLGASVFVLGKNLQTKNIIGESSEKTESIITNSFLYSLKESFYNNIVLENRYLLILDGLQTTIIISILATIFGTLLGGLICFMRMSKNKILLIPAKIYISILRGTPVLVILMIIFYVVFASVDIEPVIVAVIAFGLNFAAYVSEMYRTGIEGVDKGQTEAGIAMGFTKVTTFIYIILPQAVKRILPVYKGEVISLVKMTSIVGYIAVQDLTKASDIIRSRTFDAFFPLIMVAVLYFIISWLLMFSLGYVERMTSQKPKLKRGV
jgi:polar amino acid transport system substrate-binding protein